MKLKLFRGLPGSGKSFLAHQEEGTHWEADMFFEKDGEYNFQGNKLPEAHKWCQDNVRIRMEWRDEQINVSNTCTRIWEMQSYLDLAKEFGYDVEVIHVQGDWGSEHSITQESFKRMEERWETYEGETIIENKRS